MTSPDGKFKSSMNTPAIVQSYLHKKLGGKCPGSAELRSYDVEQAKRMKYGLN